MKGRLQGGQAEQFPEVGQSEGTSLREATEERHLREITLAGRVMY